MVPDFLSGQEKGEGCRGETPFCQQCHLGEVAGEDSQSCDSRKKAHGPGTRQGVTPRDPSSSSDTGCSQDSDGPGPGAASPPESQGPAGSAVVLEPLLL